MADRIGEWFQTHSGRQFYPLDPRVEDIDIEDIAHALARLCRFNGHVKTFYSVAQHSVLVSIEVERAAPSHYRLEGYHDAVAQKAVWSDALAGLLHDAAEAYLGDMIRPLKVSMPAYRDAEQKLEAVIAKRFGLAFPWPALVKVMDDRLLATERRDVLAVQRPWSFRAEPIERRIECLPPGAAEHAFLERFYRLFPLANEVRRG